MTSGIHTWHVAGFKDLAERCYQGECLYGPEFKVGELAFELDLHPKLNDWPQPGALYLRLVSSSNSSVENLKIRANFTVPELGYSGACTVKDSVANWKAGFGPKDHSKLGEALASYQGGDLTLTVALDVVEVTSPGTTTFRMPFDRFEDLRAAHAGETCKAGFHVRHSRRFEIHGPKFGILAFRADVHPNIDATGNLYVSFKLEKAGPKVDSLQLEYELCLEELGYSAASESLSGTCGQWSRALGLAGQPTACPALRPHTGTLTVRIKVCVAECLFVEEKQQPPLWSDLVSSDFRYLLLSAAGPCVKGTPETMDAAAAEDAFPAACEQNVARLRSMLLQGGVPAASILVVDFGSADELPHPREVLERFFAASERASKLVVYFSGNALAETGAWCLRWRPKGQRYGADVAVTPLELFAWRAASANAWRAPLLVIVEAVASGSWCTAAREVQLTGRVLAACAPDGAAWARSDGSLFTDWLMGRSGMLPAERLPESRQAPWDYSVLGTAGELQLPAPEQGTAPSADKLASTLGSTGSTALPPVSRPTTGMDSSTTGGSLSLTAPSRSPRPSSMRVSPKTRRSL